MDEVVAIEGELNAIVKEVRHEMDYFMTNFNSNSVLCMPNLVSLAIWRNKGRSHGWQQTYPLTICINMWTVSSDVSIERRQWQPLSVHFLWVYCTAYPTLDVTDMWRLASAPGSTSSSFFEQWFGFFFLPQELDKWSALRQNLQFFDLIRED